MAVAQRRQCDAGVSRSGLVRGTCRRIPAWAALHVSWINSSSRVHFADWIPEPKRSPSQRRSHATNPAPQWGACKHLRPISALLVGRGIFLLGKGSIPWGNSSSSSAAPLNLPKGKMQPRNQRAALPPATRAIHESCSDPHQQTAVIQFKDH